MVMQHVRSLEEGGGGDLWLELGQNGGWRRSMVGVSAKWRVAEI